MIKLAQLRFTGFRFPRFSFSGFKFLGLRFPGFGQKNNEGPPDLDQVLRDLSQKINNLFGKGKGAGGFNSNNQPADNKDFNVPIAPILAIIAAIWLATGFYIVVKIKCVV